VTLWTGLGLSLTTATYLRWVLLFLCVASLLFLPLKKGTQLFSAVWRWLPIRDTLAEKSCVPNGTV
jgi:hypothetical protein